jgi:hypothetical protein
MTKRFFPLAEKSSHVAVNVSDIVECQPWKAAQPSDRSNAEEVNQFVEGIYGHVGCYRTVYRS